MPGGQRSIAAAEYATFRQFANRPVSDAQSAQVFPVYSGLTFSTPTYSLNTADPGLYIGTTGAGAITINATTGGVAGQTLELMITNDAGGARTVTFGTNFRSTGTLTGTASKVMLMEFWSDGTNWIEASRTVAIT